MMDETGLIVQAERKFPIYSDFLDTVLVSQGIIQEGETRQQAILRVIRELEETAEELKRNIEHPTYGKYPLTPDESTRTITPSAIQVEFRNGHQDALDGIKAAQTLEELATYHKLSGQNTELYNAYCKRLKELSNVNKD